MNIELVKTFIKVSREQEAWLDSVPVSIRISYIDNEYINGAEYINDQLMQACFTVEQYEDIYTYMYDGCKGIILKDGREFKLNSDAGFISYLEEVYGYD